jgi:hypothetical protein
MLDTTTLLSAEQVSARRHLIRLHVMTRPDRPQDWLAHYRTIAEQFAATHRVRLLPGLDFEPTPMRESGTLRFHVKEWKGARRRTG